MKTNFLSLLFFCSVYVSTYAQELQSPQINQNAIFANPGLAGSKGQTRICTAVSGFNSNHLTGGSWDNNEYLNKTFEKRNLYSGLVSIDGLTLKSKLGLLDT